MTVLVQFQVKTGHQVVLFLDLPTDLEEQIQNSLSSVCKAKNNPFLWHTILAKQAKALYNDAVWSMRDLVRSVEKVCNILWPLLPEILNPFKYRHEMQTEHQCLTFQIYMIQQDMFLT